MKRKNVNNKGITLIALVITIIVLLILAGVAISMLSGENGILKQAGNVKEETQESQRTEEATLVDMEDKINGYVSENLMTTKIKPSNYGDEVKGYIDLDENENTNDWLIFNKEGNNVWIITKDYVELDDATAKSVGMTTNGYYAWWDTTPDYGKEYINSNSVESLIDINKWTKYVDSDMAIKAMGGPTLQMFASSYNSKYPSEEIGILDYTYYVCGYKVGWKKNQEVDYKDQLDGLKDDSLYVIDETPDNTGNAFGYWLASPSSKGTRNITVIYSDYSIWYVSNFYSDEISLRPVVCLKSDVEYTYDENTKVWTIE